MKLRARPPVKAWEKRGLGGPSPASRTQSCESEGRERLGLELGGGVPRSPGRPAVVCPGTGELGELGATSRSWETKGPRAGLGGVTFGEFSPHLTTPPRSAGLEPASPPHGFSFSCRPSGPKLQDWGYHESQAQNGKRVLDSPEDLSALGRQPAEVTGP